MERYITLVKWTPQGLSNLGQIAERIQQKRKAFRDAGGELLEFHLVLGEFDAVAISEVPDDEAYHRALLTLQSMGNFLATTMKVFPETEYLNISQSMRLASEETRKQGELSTAYIKLIENPDVA